MMCGLPGAGKTTLAKTLESEHSAVRLCPDDWILTLLEDSSDLVERNRLREPVERLQWELGQRLLNLGQNVILENGFWSREERQSFREAAQALGAEVKLEYLEVPLEELWRRLQSRSGTFTVTRQELEQWWKDFEPPQDDERA